MKNHYHELNKFERFLNSPWFILVIIVSVLAFSLFCIYAQPWDWQIWTRLGIK